MPDLTISSGDLQCKTLIFAQYFPWVFLAKTLVHVFVFVLISSVFLETKLVIKVKLEFRIG